MQITQLNQLIKLSTASSSPQFLFILWTIDLELCECDVLKGGGSDIKSQTNFSWFIRSLLAHHLARRQHWHNSRPAPVKAEKSNRIVPLLSVRFLRIPIEWAFRSIASHWLLHRIAVCVSAICDRPPMAYWWRSHNSLAFLLFRSGSFNGGIFSDRLAKHYVGEREQKFVNKLNTKVLLMFQGFSKVRSSFMNWWESSDSPQRFVTFSMD